MKTIKVSSRLLKVPASPIRKLVPYAQEAKRQGVKVFHLNIGDPDIKTPEVMIDVLRNWEQNPIKYAHSQGEPDFLKALQIYYQRIGFDFVDTKNIIVTNGSSEGLSMVLFAIADQGGEIITFDPYYANYSSFAVINNVKLKPILTEGKNGFHLPDKKTIEKNITKKTRAILYCNPNNPTGTVYSKKEVEMLVEIAKEYNLFLISDEAYREFSYDGKKQVSILSYMKKIPQQAILIDCVSKRYSLCGARLGMIVSLNEDLMDGVLRIAQGRLSSGFINQKMAAKLTEVPESYFKKVHSEYQKRRDVLYSGLKKIKGVFLEKPEGAFYAVVKLPVVDAEDFCQWLLTKFRYKKSTVMLAPAAGFYASPDLGRNEVRIAYVLNVHDLQRSIEILEKALVEY